MCTVAALAHAQGDAAAARGVAQRVVDQVAQGFAQLQGIALNGQVLFALVPQVHAGGERARRPFARHFARERGQVQRLAAGLGFGAGQGQQLVHEVGAALGAGAHLGQALGHARLAGLALGQFHLADQPGQRRAQLVGGVVDETFLLLHTARHLTQETVDGQHQRVHLARCLRHADGRERVDRAVFQLCRQAGQRGQPAPDAAIHQQAQQHTQRQQRHQHVGHELARDALLHRQALADLHAQDLRRAGLAVAHVQRHDAQRPAVEHAAVEHRVAGHQRRVGWRRQALVAEQELARRRGHHVADAVVGILLQHVLRGLGEVDQQARTDRLDLARQRPHRLRERLVDALLDVRQGEAIGQQTAAGPEHQLRQQQPQQQLAAQGQARRGDHGAPADSSR
ncbi:hypothetical protein D9M69_488060 [compost metagenome]